MKFESENLGYPLRNIESEITDSVLLFIESIIEIVDKNKQNIVLNELRNKLKK